MSLPSFSSNALRILRVEEEGRLFKIQSIIEGIYPHVLRMAKYTAETVYYHEIQFAERMFYTTNMAAILSGLKHLFPDAYVAHTLLTPGDDGKLYDVTKLDDVTLNRVNKTKENSYIVIDWS
jgi:hypothetical protein